MALQSVIMYLVQSEAEIPQQVLPNTSYYIIGREVRIYDNAGQLSVFTSKNDKKENNNELEKRLGNCEKKIEKIYKHLTSFVGDE